MFKSMRYIIITLIIYSVIMAVFYSDMIKIKETYKENIEMSKETLIIVNENGKVKIAEEILFSPPNQYAKKIVLPISVYGNAINEDTIIEPQNLVMKITYIENPNLNVHYKYSIKKDRIEIDGLSYPNGIKYNIEINYEYDVKDVVKQYKDYSVITLNSNDNFQKNNIKIQLPAETNILEFNKKLEIENLGDNTYSIDIKNNPIDILLNKESIENATPIDETYTSVAIDNYIESSTIEIVLIYFMILTIGILIFTLILTRKVKSEKIYVRNPEEVLDPILAEAIIDRKIGAKELIMSCIVELIYRGNLENIGKDKVKLVKYDNISEYEREILDLLFKEEGQQITFEQIREIFIKDNRKTKELFNKFKSIKKKICSMLFEYNIYSKLGENLLKTIRIISVGILVIMVCMFFYINSKIFLMQLIISIFMVIFLMTIKELDINLFDKTRRGTETKSDIKVRIFTEIGVIVVLAIIQVQSNLNSMLIIGLIVIFNIAIINKTNTHIFTETGKYEFRRVNGLKNYIVDYSLMKERELDSVIVWDEYLAYAVAFGIPNKITDKFSENLMNTNIVLQKIENILKI